MTGTPANPTRSSASPSRANSPLRVPMRASIMSTSRECLENRDRVVGADRRVEATDVVELLVADEQGDVASHGTDVVEDVRAHLRVSGEVVGEDARRRWSPATDASGHSTWRRKARANVNVGTPRTVILAIAGASQILRWRPGTHRDYRSDGRPIASGLDRSTWGGHDEATHDDRHGDRRSRRRSSARPASPPPAGASSARTARSNSCARRRSPPTTTVSSAT